MSVATYFNLVLLVSIVMEMSEETPLERGFYRNQRSVAQQLLINSCLLNVCYGDMWSNLEILQNNSILLFGLLLTSVRGSEQGDVNKTCK